MSTIYRKYRPQFFSDVIGQEHIVKTIANEITADKVAHAYLFAGPRGTGKTTLARLLAKAINCQNQKNNKFEPCGECSSCAEISAGRNIDVIEIDAASHTGVDNVRENIIENAQFKPTKSKYKVFIVDEVHMLSNSAFNALLKTLEEPPGHVIFVLATTEQHKLPSTIISRCQRFGFKRVGYDDMMERLEKICKSEKIKVDKKVLERIVNKSDGCMRDAESLLGQILSLDLKTIGPEDAEIILPASSVGSILKFINSVIDRQTAEAVKIIGALSNEGVNLEQFAYDTLEVLRLVMILQADPQTKTSADYSGETIKIIKKTADKITPLRLVKMIESLISRRRDIKSAPLPQLPLELFVIEFTCEQPAVTARPHLNLLLTGEEGVDPSPIRRGQGEVSPMITDNQEKFPHNITQTIKDTLSNLTHKPIQTTLEQIKSRWNEIIEIISKENHSLGFILKMSEVRSIDNDGLRISVPYSFHKDKIDGHKTKKIIEKCLHDVFLERINLYCEVSEEMKPKNEDDELTKLAADFGGEVA